MNDLVTPKSDATTTMALPASLGPALVAAGVGATVLLAGAMMATAPDLVAPAVLGGGAAVAGTIAGWLGMAAAARSGRIEPGFLVLGGSIFRATFALLVGLVARSILDLPPRPFWLSFLFVIGCVIAAEVIITRRALDRKELSRS